MAFPREDARVVIERHRATRIEASLDRVRTALIEASNLSTSIACIYQRIPELLGNQVFRDRLRLWSESRREKHLNLVVAKAREILFDVHWFRAEAENQEKHLSDTRSVDQGHYRSPHLDEDVPER